MNKRERPALNKIIEFREVLKLTKDSPRIPHQQNLCFESDCEIVKLNKTYLCASTDSLGEEISMALYRDPYTWGWLTVMSSVSDLAVTGALPIGLLLSTQWKFKTSEVVKKRFYHGVNAALRKAGVGLLGGDSGYAADHVFTSAIFGQSTRMPLTRMGARAGDIVAVLGRRQTGVGPCIAFRYLLELGENSFPEKFLRPLPPLQTLHQLRPLIRASIDTSDGLAACLHLVARLNGLGLELSWNESLIHPAAQRFCQDHRIHPLMLWLNDLGDLQPLLFISPKNFKKAQQLAPDLIPIGSCSHQRKDYRINYKGQIQRLPLEEITASARDATAIKKLFKKLNRQLLATLNF